MIRIMGFITGSAVAVAAILLVLGVPELQSRDTAIPRPEPPPMQPPEPVVAQKPAVAAPAEPVAAFEPAAEEQEPTPEPVVESPPLSDAGIDTKWHSFWSPFRSQIAANGFVSRLESVTGFDYRVVKVDAGVYEVAFAYNDDAERTQKLSTIAAATGLEIPES